MPVLNRCTTNLYTRTNPHLAAATLLALAPVLVLLPFLHKYLIKGLSLGALK